MADFELEQLKTLFENLGDRLDRTKGDQLSRDELHKIRVMLNRMGGEITRARQAPNGKVDQQTLIRQVVQATRGTPGTRTNINRDLGVARGTIIEEERRRRQQKQDNQGLSFLERRLREAGQSTGAFGKDVARAGGEAGNLSRKLGGVGGGVDAMLLSMAGVGKEMLKTGLERADYYRVLLASGEGTVDSMQAMGREAAKAGLTVEQFVTAMEKGTQGARSLGAIKFADVRKSVVEMTRASGYMGLLPDQITEVTSTYAEILRQQGMNRDQSSEQMARGIVSLVKTSEATAHILGQTREEALKAQADLAKDAQLNAIMAAKGIDPDTARSLINQVTQLGGQSGKNRLYDQLFTGQAGPDSAAFQATNVELGNAIGKIGDLVRSGQSGQELLFRSAEELKAAGARQVNDKTSLEQKALIARYGRQSDLTQALTDGLGFAFQSQSLKNGTDFNQGSNQNQNDQQRAAVGLLQVEQVAQEFKVMKDSLVTAVFNPMVTTFGPLLRDTVNPALTKFAQGLTGAALSMEGHTTIMATLGATVLGVTGGLGLLLGATSIASKGLGLLGLLKGGASMGGAAGTAAAVGGAAARGAMRATPLVAGLVETGGYAFGDKDLTWKNLAKSGLALGGGALGAVGGGVATGGLGGQFLGGAAGYAGGRALGNWIFGEDDLKRPLASPAPNPTLDDKGKAQKASQNPSQVPASKPTKEQPKDNTKVRTMENHEQSVIHLRQIKEDNMKILDAARDQIGLMRAANDRMVRVLEEISKNTRSIADHTG